LRFSAAIRTVSAPGRTAGETEIAGERAICDPRGILYFPELRLLAVSDLHLEKGSSFARRRVFIPPYDTAMTLLRLQQVIAEYQPEAVISLGDSFHDGKGAERMPEVFRQQLLMLMAGRDWYWIAGNHDPEAPHGLPGETAREIAVAKLLFRHQPSAAAAEGEIAGHLHPGARVVRRGQSVRRPCFASDGRRMVMPAFGAFTGTLNVLDRAYAGMFRWPDFKAYVLGSRRIYPIAGTALFPG
jgi:DNA ligase-associated metallophosphoesterase